jgi:hypothetical protein
VRARRRGNNALARADDVAVLDDRVGPVLVRVARGATGHHERHPSAQRARDAVLAQRRQRPGMVPHRDGHVDPGLGEWTCPTPLERAARKGRPSRLVTPRYLMPASGEVLDRRVGGARLGLQREYVHV